MKNLFITKFSPDKCPPLVLEKNLNIKPYHMFPLNFCNMYMYFLEVVSQTKTLHVQFLEIIILFKKTDFEVTITIISVEF